jgi:hypothetical protein
MIDIKGRAQLRMANGTLAILQEVKQISVSLTGEPSHGSMSRKV